MDKSAIEKIAKQVYRQFPEVAGSSPKVSVQGGEDRFLLVFNGRGSSPKGKAMPRHVRVVANAKGKILKMTTSR